MEQFTRILVLFTIFIIAAISVSGCTDNSAPAPADTPVVTTAAGPVYTAGDIVKSASGTDSPAWLVVGYDAATDSYTRALIYKKTDGSYGYRMNSATETTKRASLEKIYSVKITHVAVDSIPTGTPTTVATAMTTATTSAATASATATTATISTDRPSIKDMSPDAGEAGTSVTTEITGGNFDSNATALLRHSGESSITASTVSYYSAQSITCIFNLPNTTRVGQWDIVVTNPNGLSGEYNGFFTVHGNSTAST